jgi:hypothetical protein
LLGEKYICNFKKIEIELSAIMSLSRILLQKLLIQIRLIQNQMSIKIAGNKNESYSHLKTIYTLQKSCVPL